MYVVSVVIIIIEKFGKIGKKINIFLINLSVWWRPRRRGRLVFFLSSQFAFHANATPKMRQKAIAWLRLNLPQLFAHTKAYKLVHR